MALNGGIEMNRPVSVKIISSIRAGEKVQCPKCGKTLNYKGNKENASFIYCESPECKYKLIVN